MKNQSKKVAHVLSTKNPIENLRKILIQLMDECDIDSMRLSRNTGVPISTINRLRSGTSTNNPTLSTLIPLAEFFSITVSQLIGDEPFSQNRTTGAHKPDKIAWKMIDHLTWEQASQWPEKKPEPGEDMHNAVSTDLTVSDIAFALTMEGDSMSPRFPEGTILIIDPEQKSQNRDFILMLLKGQNKPLFKQLLIDGDEQYIKSLNPDFAEIKKIAQKDGSKIIGVMIQAISNFKK